MVWAVLARMDGRERHRRRLDRGRARLGHARGRIRRDRPDGAVTREMLVTMLWRFAGEPATAADLNGYADGDDAASWAADAFAWAIEI